jgi:hypothetical protein
VHCDLVIGATFVSRPCKAALSAHSIKAPGSAGGYLPLIKETWGPVDLEARCEGVTIDLPQIDAGLRQGARGSVSNLPQH